MSSLYEPPPRGEDGDWSSTSQRPAPTIGVCFSVFEWSQCPVAPYCSYGLPYSHGYSPPSRATQRNSETIYESLDPIGPAEVDKLSDITPAYHGRYMYITSQV